MKLSSFEAIVSALHDADVRYLIAGGLAVNAHGYLRFTKDIDVIIQLHPDNVTAAFAALHTLGYNPLVPITAQQFSDSGLRNTWIHDKGMRVLQFWSNSHPETPVDVFVTEPFDFDEEYNHALVKPLGKISIRFATIISLIKMKQEAGRPQDKIDIEYLQNLLKEHE